ncbi:protein phosphatase [Streptomyces sp. Ru73]|uniref:SpoIIE family protein phosphatase n=1 Tax=Streptomyces sp. Ru73 TaxID=2080748 RepID=UPI000CDD7E34|nr:SpoIIE family protein phosphatase [Streptomyces sp. Ru73]POX40071.1 protein phosphatase [Streptomyces sp. Ru73]
MERSWDGAEGSAADGAREPRRSRRSLLGHPGQKRSGRPDIALPELLALNRMGAFDWNLDNGAFDLDPGGLAVFDLRPEEFDGTRLSLLPRVPQEEGYRLDTAVVQAIQQGRRSCGAYFRIRCRDGTPRWTHAQGRILRDGGGRAYRMAGIVREATAELADSALLNISDEQRERQTRLVQWTTTALSRALSVKDVTEVLTAPGGPLQLGADSLVLGLVENGVFDVIAATPPLDGPPELLHQPLDRTLPLSDAVVTREPGFVSSHEELLQRYPRLRPYVEHISIRSAAFLPLVAQDKVIGGLALINTEAKVYTAEDRNLALALAGVIAQSLQRATLFDQEREFATGLQSSMLPRRIPAINGGDVAVRYHAGRTGRDVGGDWYDVVPLPQGRTGVVIGDVQGHDTHAAAVMGQLRIALRAFAGEGHPPQTVLGRASRFLTELETERFATCTYIQADLSSGVLHVARAGHLEPLLVDAERHVHWPTVHGGLPLGLATAFGEDHYPETQLFLEPGSTLLLCTDGLVEQPGSDIIVGLEALTAAVRDGPGELDELADHLSALLWEQPGSPDDMALLLLRRLAEPGGPAKPRIRLHVHQADPAGPAEVRTELRRMLDQWRAGAVAGDVELVATELITNALRHTDSGALVSLELRSGPPDRIRLEVEDRSSHWPRRREPGETATTGRGLLLVEALSDRWGAEARGAGKALWCEFSVPCPGDS